MNLTIAMAHQRKLIRQAVAATLLAANTAAGTRVTATRIEPNLDGELPAISVYTLEDDVDSTTVETAPREFKHDLKLEITAWVAHRDSYSADDQMDDIAEQIEAAMEANRYLDNNGESTAGDSELTGSVMGLVEDDGRSDPVIGIIVLSYGITYRAAPTPPTLTDDFLTADNKTQVEGGVSDTPVSEDTFQVRTP